MSRDRPNDRLADDPLEAVRNRSGVVGTARASWIVLPPAHGGAAIVRPLLERLKAQVRVWAPPLPADCTAPVDVATALVAALDAAGSERAGVIGLSLGGQLAQALVEHHPQRVAALLLVASGAPDRARGRALARSGWLARWLPRRVLLARARAQLAESLSEVGVARGSELLAEMAEATRAELAAPRARLQASDRLGADAPAAFAARPAPVRLIELAADGVIAASESARLRALFPQAQVEVIPALRHAALIGWPVALLERVAAAVMELSAQAALGPVSAAPTGSR